MTNCKKKEDNFYLKNNYKIGNSLQIGNSCKKTKNYNGKKL